MSELPKNGSFTTSYSPYEPIPFRPSSYQFPMYGKSIGAYNLIATTGNLGVISKSWSVPGTIQTPKGAVSTMNGSGRIYHQFERGVSIDNFSAAVRYRPKKGAAQEFLCNELTFGTVDQVIEWAIDFAGLAATLVRKVGQKNLAKLMQLAKDTSMKSPLKWDGALFATDPRIISYLPNSLTEAEAEAYAKLPQPMTAAAAWDMSSGYILALYIIENPDGVHYSAEVKFLKTNKKNPKQAKLLGTFDATEYLPDQLAYSYISFWQQKVLGKNPQIVHGSYLMSPANNQVVSGPWDDASLIMNTSYNLTFNDGTDPLIPMRWHFAVRNKEEQSQVAKKKTAKARVAKGKKP